MAHDFSHAATDAETDAFFDLMEWRERRSAESAFGRLEVFANRVRHALPAGRRERRF